MRCPRDTASLTRERLRTSAEHAEIATLSPRLGGARARARARRRRRRRCSCVAAARAAPARRRPRPRPAQTGATEASAGAAAPPDVARLAPETAAGAGGAATAAAGAGPLPAGAAGVDAAATGCSRALALRLSTQQLSISHTLALATVTCAPRAASSRPVLCRMTSSDKLPCNPARASRPSQRRARTVTLAALALAPPPNAVRPQAESTCCGYARVAMRPRPSSANTCGGRGAASGAPSPFFRARAALSRTHHLAPADQPAAQG